MRATCFAGLLVLAACHHAAEPDPIDQSLQPGVVKVIDAGGSDRRVLRFHPAPGSQQVMTLEVSAHAVDPRGGPLDMQATMAETVTVAAGADGSSALTATVDGMKMGDKALPIEGAAVRMRLAPDGQVSDIAGDNPTALQLVRSLQAVVAYALPSEPIGPGARWRYLTHLDDGGMMIGLQASYQLTSLDGDHAVVHVRLRPKMDAGSATATADGSGEGDLTLDLSKPLPTAATLAVTLTLLGPDGGHLTFSETLSIAGT